MRTVLSNDTCRCHDSDGTCDRHIPENTYHLKHLGITRKINKETLRQLINVCKAYNWLDKTYFSKGNRQIRQETSIDCSSDKVFLTYHGNTVATYERSSGDLILHYVGCWSNAPSTKALQNAILPFDFGVYTRAGVTLFKSPYEEEKEFREDIRIDNWLDYFVD